jgi:hypothetical protein
VDLSFGKVKNPDGAGIFLPTVQPYAASNSMTVMPEYGTLANPWAYDATRTIYLPEGWTGGTPAELFMLMRWFITFKMC